MKKICMLVAVAIALVAGFSCTQGEKEVKITKTEQAAFDELRVQITALNEEFGVDDTDSRANNQRKKRRWRIFGADMLGGVLGYIKGNFFGALRWGVGLSVKAARTYNANNDEGLVYVPVRALNGFAVGDMAGSTDAIMSRLDSIGYYHNQVICDLYDVYGDELFTMSESTCEQLIEERALVYAGNSNNGSTGVVINESEVNELLDNMDDDNIEETFEALNEMLPDYSAEFQIVQEYCETIITFETDEELMEYARAHYNLLLASTISEYAKSLIGTGTGTGAGSAIIWNPIKKPVIDDELEPIVP